MLTSLYIHYLTLSGIRVCLLLGYVNCNISVLCWQPFPPTAAAANANALAGWMVNAAASSSVQAAVVTASSLPVPPNQGNG